MFTFKGKVTPFYFKLVVEGKESTEFCKVEEIEPTYAINDPNLIGVRVINNSSLDRYCVEYMKVRPWYLNYKAADDMDFVECSEEEFDKNLNAVKQKLSLK